MNDKDKEAFEKWELDYFGQNDNCPHYMLHIKNTWQAACEYKDAENKKLREGCCCSAEEQYTCIKCKWENK